MDSRSYSRVTAAVTAVTAAKSSAKKVSWSANKWILIPRGGAPDSAWGWPGGRVVGLWRNFAEEFPPWAVASAFPFLHISGSCFGRVFA